MRDINIIIEEFKHRHHHHAKSLQFTFHGSTFSISGEDMNFTLNPGNQVPFSVAPLLADGVTPSQATLSNVSFTTSGPFSVAPDPSNPNGGILTCPAGTTSGATDNLIGVATATETDGVTTEQVSGTVSLTAGTGTV